MNKRVISVFKDEAGGIIILDFAGLKAKLYSYKMLEGEESKNCTKSKPCNKCKKCKKKKKKVKNVKGLLKQSWRSLFPMRTTKNVCLKKRTSVGR